MFNHHLGMDWVIKSSPHVARCPPHLPVSFGFDTACKTYATLVGGGSDSQIIVKANGLCRVTWQMVNTPRKINMEPENTPLEKENHLPNYHFQVLC